ncbi:DUF2922 domain-containing protein [Halalkalibacter urbisdiaboli]|uniref:DUF2922 domain-containing protein n=1 Tax=Halalkalibacter urbisdiaboli TaxID=1960589 RepID=UPI000B44A3A4|nr:DUF2922 domain-containing protein [Halalkalibacter urbisdiaboli]
MSKKLELLFENTEGRLVTISLDDPVEPVNGSEVQTVMSTIIENAAFLSSGGEIETIRGARIVERNVEDINLP